MAKNTVVIEIAGHQVTISSPDKVYFPDAGHTKLDLVRYYQHVADGAVRGIRDRPLVLKRFVDGIAGKPFFQKRAPKSLPPFVSTVTFAYPSGRTADEVVVHDAAGLLWCANLGCLDLNPHPVRADDLEHPDELRIDLDPVRGVPWSEVRVVALVARDVLEEHGLIGWPKTSGSRGLHVDVRIARRWVHDQVRDAALALAREVEQRMPGRATARWFKEERTGVFLDYNQNARDRTVASAYSVRPLPDARVSAPLEWSEVPDCEPAAFTLATMPARYDALGDLREGMDHVDPGELDSLLALHAEQEARGEGDRRAAPRPLRVIAQHTDEDAALAGLERWRARWPEAAAWLEPHHVLVDRMRGRYRTWTRIRVNLEAVPEEQHPPEEPPDPDEPFRWGTAG